MRISSPSYRWQAAVAGAAVLFAWLAGHRLVAAPPAGAEKNPTPATATNTDPLVERGYRVTGGAAAGYVEDRVCGSCHADFYRSYQDVGMARSFYRPRPEILIEDFTSGYLHEPSGRHYRMIRRDDRLVMKRYQLDTEGGPINEVEQEVDWILGSGNHSRTYLFRTPSGELYQLPIAWYSRTQSWGMAPGFESSDHLGLSRQIRRACMFCHNAYPDVPVGSDSHQAPHTFPEQLPEGLGCQRCHGPGAEHSRAAMAETVDFKKLYASIVNPGDLEPARRNDVCYQCHMQPSVTISGKRRFGRSVYSFRPGERLSDYLLQVDVVEAGQDREERFEINHHPYRLEQSRCFVASEGAMSCLTCHDPHRKVPEVERAAHYRAACLSCHQLDACSLEDMATTTVVPKVAADDCAACHMQKRRTQDVVRVLMTDHLIRRHPGGPELVAPLAPRKPDIEDIVFLRPEEAPKGAQGNLHRAYAVADFTSGGHTAAVAELERQLAQLRPPEPEPYLVLAQGQLKQGRLQAAKNTLEQILEQSPGFPMARELLGLVQGGLGRREAAVAGLLEALEHEPNRPETSYNLGVLLTRFGRSAEALSHLERAIDLRPNLAGAWFKLGEVQATLNRPEDAIYSYRRALALEPTHSPAYLALGRLLIRRDQRAEALRYWQHGTKYARQPGPIVEALAQLEQETAQ